MTYACSDVVSKCYRSIQNVQEEMRDFEGRIEGNVGIFTNYRLDVLVGNTVGSLSA